MPTLVLIESRVERRVNGARSSTVITPGWKYFLAASSVLPSKDASTIVLQIVVLASTYTHYGGGKRGRGKGSYYPRWQVV
jgi:hypothetical protein